MHAHMRRDQFSKSGGIVRLRLPLSGNRWESEDGISLEHYAQFMYHSRFVAVVLSTYEKPNFNVSIEPH